MGGEGSVDEKLAPQDFVADFLWAARALLQKPSVALVSMAAWTLPTLLFAIARGNKNLLAGVIGIGLSLFALGWLGAERKFFRERREGANVSLRELFASVPSYVGRFLRLGILVGFCAAIVTGVPIVGAAALAAAHEATLANAIIHAAVLTITVVLDLALTFVTSALAFTTPSAREALRIGIRMIRQTWPRSGLYVLCPPLALNLLSAMYPMHLPVVTAVRTAGLVILALVAKGATAAFYLRERPVSTDATVDAH
jgi:hypothetical protein